MEAGLEPADVKDLSRLLEPDVELRFQNVGLDPKMTADMPMFACSHLTPELMRQPGWTEHPNGAIGIKTLTAVTNEPGAVMERMGRIFGEARITETDNTVAVHTGRSVLLFATPDDLDMLHPELEMELETDQATLAVPDHAGPRSHRRRRLAGENRHTLQARGQRHHRGQRRARLRRDAGVFPLDRNGKAYPACSLSATACWMVIHQKQ